MKTIKDAYQKLDTIPAALWQDDLVYQGYFWRSDRTRPEVVNWAALNQEDKADKKTLVDLLENHTLPFVVEANFYCKNNGQPFSLQIKNIDGRHHIARIELSDLPSDQIDNYTYLTHDIKSDKHPFSKYKVVEAWQVVKDPLLNDMETLQPAWVAFAGFDQ